MPPQPHPPEPTYLLVYSGDNSITDVGVEAIPGSLQGLVLLEIGIVGIELASNEVSEECKARLRQRLPTASIVSESIGFLRSR